MRFNKNQMKKKCESDKYFSAIKYMAHTLKGKEREQFIKMICDINIYLGSMCAATCEKNKIIDNYIWNKLNTYFEPKLVKYHDNVTTKKLNSNDISNYLLACNIMGNFKAIKWYIHNHEILKTTILKLAKTMDENQLIELISTLYESEKNWNKIRGVGSTRNLYLYKHDDRIKRILKGLWYKDRDAFVQLAYDTGWLSELGKGVFNRNDTYVECLKRSNKLLLAIQLIEESLTNKIEFNSFDTLINILKKDKNNGYQYIYIVYLQKIQCGYQLTNSDYDIVRKLSTPSDKVKNYFISLFLQMVNGAYMHNIDYFETANSFKKVLVKPLKLASKIGNSTNTNLRIAIKRSSKINIDKVFERYFGTTMSVKASLDELFRLLNFYHGVQANDFIKKLSAYPIWAKVVDESCICFKEISTVKYVKCVNEIKKGTEIMVLISEYDYIDKQFYSVPHVGNIKL